MTLPAYVEDGVGLPVFRGPYMQEDAELGVLLLHADKQKLQDLCDHYLNGPAQGAVRYKALLPYVMLVLTNMTIYSLDPADINIGRMQEADLSFWVLVAVEKYKNGRYVFDHLAWYLPYVFVNNPYAVATGREVYGFPKIYAQFDLPQNIRNPEFSVNTLAFANFGPNEQGTQQWLMSVRRSSDANSDQPTSAAKEWSHATEAVGAIIKLLAGNERGAVSLLDEAKTLIDLASHFSLNVPMVFLKQFRDVADTTLAAYQAVIEAPARPTKFRGGWLLRDTYEVHLNQLASFPLAETMGLQMTNGVQQAAAGFWINMDFVMELGKVVAPPQPPAPQPKRKIAVLGGGVGAMAAAFALTSEPNWQQRYDVDVYQLGWRLGGKGASGRQQDDGERILEHGLHIWFGFYANAFHVMNACYEELNRSPDAPLATIADAFKPQSVVGVTDFWRNQWTPWLFNFPTSDEVPWDGAVERSPFTYLKKLIEWAYQMFKDFRSHSAALTSAAPQPEPGSLEAEVVERTREIATVAADVLRRIAGSDAAANAAPPHPAHLVAANALAETMHQLGQHFEDRHRITAAPAGEHVSIPLHHRFLATVIDQLRAELKHYESTLESLPEKLRELWILLDLALVNGYGLLMSGVLTHGFSIIDDIEYRQWLLKYGASETVAYSAPVRAYYDLAFAYPQGNVGPNEPSTAGNTGAGTALHSILLILFAYKGAVMWKMQAGMGDVVFAPFYEVLRKRGVKFHFFHKITALEPAADGKQIDKILYNRQVTLNDGADFYEPLINVNGLPSWPSAPLYDQIAQGQQLQEQNINLESAWTPWVDVEQGLVLQRGVDFDEVVLGISLGALKDICAPLVAINQDWAAMVNNVQTVQTQAMQLWFTQNLAGLGWTGPSSIIDAYAQPFNTWADMSQVLAAEDWPSGAQPGNVSYFCGPLQDAPVIPPYSDHAFPEQQLLRVKQAASAWVKANLGRFMPNVVDSDGNVNWSLFFDSADQDGEARFWAQFFRANIDPTERYVLSVAGTSQYRLRGDQSGFANLVLAGDWTDNGVLNVGAVEPAVISGLQAARALSGTPLSIVGEHPERAAGDQPVSTAVPTAIQP